MTGSHINYLGHFGLRRSAWGGTTDLRDSVSGPIKIPHTTNFSSRIAAPSAPTNAKFHDDKLRVKLQLSTYYESLACAGLELWWIYLGFGGVVEFWWAKKFDLIDRYICTPYEFGLRL